MTLKDTKITKKLTSMPYAQARVEIQGDHIALISYATKVAEIRDGWLKILGLYSATTRKHIGAFVREDANLQYSTARTIFEKKMEMKVETGEVREF